MRDALPRPHTDASVTLTAPDAPGTRRMRGRWPDTTNNCSDAVHVAVSEPPVQPAPDLHVASPTVSDSSPDAGTPFTLSATVRNAGTAPPPPPCATSVDGCGDHHRRHGRRHRYALAAAASTDASVTLTAPDAPGTYYYGACVDLVAGESDTTNNCSDAVHVAVSEPPVQHLHVASPTVSDSSPDAGTPFTLSATCAMVSDGCPPPVQPAPVQTCSGPAGGDADGE